MEIKKTSLEISNIKYPLIFLFNLIQYKNELGDTNLSIILRLFLKHHITIALDFNLKAIFENDFGDFKLCRAVLIDFYSIIKKQTSLIFILKKWFDAYDKKSFWLLNVEEQLERLTNMKHIFYGIYDCSKGGVPLFNKLRTDNIINNIDTKETIKERLIQLLNLFGMKLFKILDISINLKVNSNVLFRKKLFNFFIELLAFEILIVVRNNEIIIRISKSSSRWT